MLLPKILLKEAGKIKVVKIFLKGWKSGES